MTAVGRYAGRLGGPGIDDSLAGPEIVASLFSADAVTIDDPVSFPWTLVETEQWRVPITVDLRATSDNDLIALADPLPVLTPADRVIVDHRRVDELGARLGLPPSTFAAEPTVESSTDLEARAATKLGLALRREALAPIIDHELDLAGGADDPRPLLVVDWGAADDWHSSLVPEPHRYRRTPDLAGVPPESAAIILVSGDRIDGVGLSAAVDRLLPGGLVVLVLTGDTVSRASAPSMTELLEAVAEATDRRRVIEHVWGLHPRPGGPTLGAVVAFRPLGGPR